MTFSEMFDKKYLGRIVALILGVAAVVGLLFYFGYHFLDYFSSDLELTDARLKTVTETVATDGYIMRYETSLYSSASGSIVPETHDGTHVKSGALIAEVYSKTSPEIEKRLDEIDEQIALYEKNKDEDRSVLSTSGIENSIYSTLADIRLSSENGCYGDAISQKTSLLVDIKKRAILTGEITDYDVQIAKLQKEKDELRVKLGDCLESVYAKNAGYYFSSDDGYGTVFNPDKIESMTFDDFIEMTSVNASDVSSNSVGILISNYRWYIACVVSKADGAALSDMSKTNVTFTYSGTVLSMNIERIIPEIPGDRCIAVLSSGKINAGFDYTRMQPVEIATRTYTGFEIPKSALRSVDGYQGVYIKDEVTIKFRRVNIIHENDDTVICTGDPYEEILSVDDTRDPNSEEEGKYAWIQQNDIVVVSGTELQSGKVIG